MSFTIKECVIAIDALLDKELDLARSNEKEDLHETIHQVEEYLNRMQENVDRWRHFIRSTKQLELKIDFLDHSFEEAEKFLFENTASKFTSILNSIEKKPIFEEKDRHPSIYSYLQSIHKALHQIDEYINDTTYETIERPYSDQSDLYQLYLSIKKKVQEIKGSFYKAISLNTIPQDLRLITVCIKHIRNLIMASRRQLLNIKSTLSDKSIDQELVDEYIQIEMIQVKKLVQQIGNTLDITGPAAKRIHAKVRREFIIPTLSYIAGLIDTLALFPGIPKIGYIGPVFESDANRL